MKLRILSLVALILVLIGIFFILRSVGCTRHSFTDDPTIKAQY